MSPDEARRRFVEARIARLATADAAARPHLTPLVFVVAAETVYSAVDAKPKRTRALRRLANVRENPAVALLRERYPQQRETGEVLAVDVERWSGWSAGG